MDTFKRLKKWVTGLGKLRRKKKHRNGFPVYDLDELAGYAVPILDEEGQIQGFETDREIIWGRRRQAEYPTPPVDRPTRAPLRTHPYRRPEPVARVTSPTTRRTSPAPVQRPSKRPNRAASPQGNATSTRRPSARKNAPAVPPRSNSTAAALPAPPASTLDDEWDGWPNGDFCRLFSHQDAEALDNLKVHWACQPLGGVSTGSAQAETWQDGKATRRECKGIISCTNRTCNILVRPQTRPAKIRQQVASPCACGGTLFHQKCGVISTLHTFKHGVYYQNGGSHLHQRPTTRLHLSRKEQGELRLVVENNPDAGPLKLLVGRPGPDGPGESVAAITPVLLNADRLKYERRKILKGVHGRVKSGNFVHEFAKVDEKCPNFILEAQFGSVTVIVMQTAHMKEKLVKGNTLAEAVNGIVSDAAHGYWLDPKDLLIISSTFEPTRLKCWMPGIISYANGGTAEHYRIHFFHLFNSMAEECKKQGVPVEDELFANVIDFSQAERNGFILAFVDFWQERVPGQRTVNELMVDAEALLKGCAQHFKNLVTRVKKISGVVDPSKQDIFENYARKLLHCNTMDEFTDCAESFIRDFPKAESWIRWWMLPAHATMLFPSFRKMTPELWNSLPDTTNPEEAQHWKIYAALKRRLALIPGIKGLFAFVEHYRKLEEAAAHGTKIYYGKDPQHWKRTKARLGYTKPSRHNAARRRITKSDSRPPDTSKALLSKRHVRTQQNTEYEKSYKWKDNSCWLDCALTLISTAAARDYAQSMAPMFESLPPNSPLRDLHQMVHTRTQGSIQLLGYDNGGSDLLNNQRDGFRRQIRKTRGHTDLGLRSFSSVWGWLYAICGHYRRSGVAVDPVIERAASYFRATFVSLRTCTENSSGFDHWQVSHVRPRSEFQLSRTICEKYAGNMRKWFQDVVRATKSIPQSACWQVDDGRVLCLHGNVKMQDILLNIPVVLIIEMGDTTECEWDIPATIAPYVGNAAASTAGLKYSIVGHVYGGEVYSHFTARYVSTSGAKRRIFDYNDMKHEGHAIQRSTKSFAGSLTGPSRSIKMADNYQLYGLVYHLDGGEGAQKFFRKQQVENAQKLGLKFHFDPSNDNGIPSRCELNHPHAERMEDDSAWIKKSALKNLEYVSNFPRSPKKKATAWRLPMAPRVSSSSSDSEDDAPPNTPPAPPIFPLPSPIEPDNDDVNIQSSSQITGSTTVCPVWCAGTSCEAYFPEGDNEYEEVQCSDCKWWSHIRCLPKGINWHDPAVEFICRRCQFFEPEELVLFPPPGTSNLDEGTVRWYPARFLSRDRQQQGTDLEFEFIWLDCVENAVGAGQTFSVSREFCKEVYHICEEPGKIKKSQLPKVRMPRYLDPNFAGHNNPQLEAIFESAIPSIADILTDFSDLHPLVRHYINFEKEAKKPKKRPKRGVHTTPTESSIAFDWQETIGLRSTPEQNVVKALAIAKLLRRITFDALDPEDKSSPAEWKIRVCSVGSALLQILVVQHELGEALNLNGDLLDDLLSRKIIASTFDGVPVLKLIMSCAMGQITNATTSVEKFAKFEREFTVYDEEYRPPTFRRVADSTVKPTPPITVTVKRAAEDEIEDGPSPKRVKKGEDSERPKPRRRARAKNSG